MPVKQFGGAAGATHLPPGLDRGVKQGGTFPTSKFSSQWVRLWDGFNYVYTNDNGANYIYPLSDGNFLLVDSNGITKVNTKIGTQIWYASIGGFQPNFIIEHPATGKIVYSYYNGSIGFYNSDGTPFTITGGGVSGVVAGIIGDYIMITNGATVYKINLITNTLVWSGTPAGYSNYGTTSILVSDGSFMYYITFPNTGAVFTYQKVNILAATPTRVATGSLVHTGTPPTQSFIKQIAAPSRKFSNVHFSQTNDANSTMYKFDLTALTSASLFNSFTMPIFGVDLNDDIWYARNASSGSFGSSIHKNGSLVLSIPDRLQNIGVDKAGVNFCTVYMVPYFNASSVLAQKNATMMLSPQITV